MKQQIESKKLLLIDDDEATSILINGIFEESNKVFLEASCGEEAILLFQKHSKDLGLILLNINPLKCNGCELLKTFREINPAIPVVALSAINAKELAMKCRIAGFNNWISKPFGREEIIKLVEIYLGK